jgi:hypothetical protein
MTEYLILSLIRALPLVWEYNRQITFSLTFSRTYGSIPQSVRARNAGAGTAGPSFTIDSTAKRIFRTFGTPPQPSVSGVKNISKPRLYRIGFTLGSWTGNPQFRIDLHYANPDDTPGQYITSFTPSVYDHGSGIRTVYADWGNPPSAFSGYELDWDTNYAIVLVPTVADASNKATANSIGTTAADPIPPRKCGYSTNSGTTWTFITSGSTLFDWQNSWGTLNYTSVGVAWYYESEATVPVAKSSEAFRSYFNGWASRTTPPSGFNLWQDIINGVTNPTAGTEIRFTDAYTHLIRFYTTANVAGFTQNDTASFRWHYDINPVTIDMFYASEAYLQRIDFLGSSSTTSSVRLNDSYEQEFGGAGGTSITFDPPILFWKAQVLSGAVRLRALVFE